MVKSRDVGLCWDNNSLQLLTTNFEPDEFFLDTLSVLDDEFN